jgi:hypothetical protein
MMRILRPLKRFINCRMAAKLAFRTKLQNAQSFSSDPTSLRVSTGREFRTTVGTPWLFATSISAKTCCPAWCSVVAQHCFQTSLRGSRKSSSRSVMKTYKSKCMRPLNAFTLFGLGARCSPPYRSFSRFGSPKVSMRSMGRPVCTADFCFD